jgi:hypothetical protein
MKFYQTNNKKQKVIKRWFDNVNDLKSLELRDSCRILSGTAVSKLPATFKLDKDKYGEKEMMLHDIISSKIIDDEGKLMNNVSSCYIKEKIDEYNVKVNGIKSFDSDKFFNEKLCSYRLDNEEGGGIHLCDYVEHYCRRDVDIVVESLKVFDNMIVDAFKAVNGEDVDVKSNMLPSCSYSAAGVADSFLKNSGVYDGVYTLKGPLVQYMRSFVIGGRCTLPLGNMKPFKVGSDKDKLQYIDAVSLYVSAMDELGEFPSGVPTKVDCETKTLNDVLSMGRA